MNKERIGYNFLHSGKSHYLKAATEILADNEIYNLFDTEEYYYEKNIFETTPALYFNRNATADAGITAGLTFGIILGTWVSNKVLDQIYIELKPPIISFFKQLTKKIKPEYSSSIEFQSLVHYKEHDVVVLVRIKAKSEQEIDENFNLIINTHGSARDFLNTKGKFAPIHEYSIEDGKINIEPNLFNSLDHIQSNERANTIKQMKHFVR